MSSNNKLTEYNISEMKLKLIYEVYNVYLDKIDYSFDDFKLEFDINIVDDNSNVLLKVIGKIGYWKPILDMMAIRLEESPDKVKELLQKLSKEYEELLIDLMA